MKKTTAESKSSKAMAVDSSTEASQPPTTTVDSPPEEVEVVVGKKMYSFLMMKASYIDAVEYLKNRKIGVREIAIACDVMNGSLVTRFIGLGTTIADNVVDGAKLDGLADKWGLEEAEVKRFAALLMDDPEVARAVFDLVMWFWTGEPSFRTWFNKELGID